MADALWDGEESSNESFTVSNNSVLLMPNCQLFSFQSIADVEMLVKEKKTLVFEVCNHTVARL